jgi:hypothetical protein
MKDTLIPRASRAVLACAALVLSLPACGGAVTSGVAVGKVGSSLSMHARSAPQGAEVCALQEALAAPIGGSDKQLSDTCGKALKSDKLWRKALIVLGAHGATLETLAAGGNTDNAGALEAASTGVRDKNWVDVDSSAEQAARDAVHQLVKQMEDHTAGGDLGKAIKDAGPHVKTICDGLGSYLEGQVKSLGDIQRDAEKKHAQRSDRRCGSLDNRSICVGESVIDRYVYANLFGQIALMESTHQQTRDAVAGFCAAHRKLEEAANDGRLSSGKTYAEVVDAVKAVQKAPAAAPAKK